MRRDALRSALIALTVSAGLLYLSYRMIAWGVEQGTTRDLWGSGIWGLCVGIPGLEFLVGGIYAMFVGITGRELPPLPETETAENLETHGTRGNLGSNRSVSAEIDSDDGDDSEY